MICCRSRSYRRVFRYLILLTIITLTTFYLLANYSDTFTKNDNNQSILSAYSAKLVNARKQVFNQVAKSNDNLSNQNNSPQQPEAADFEYKISDNQINQVNLPDSSNIEDNSLDNHANIDTENQNSNHIQIEETLQQPANSYVNSNENAETNHQENSKFNYKFEKVGPDTTSDYHKILTEMSYETTSLQDKKYAIQQMMKFAWDGYKTYAWGWSALDPVANTKNHGGPFGNSQSGATIIDSLDTLYIMGLEEDYREGVKWLEENFKRNFLGTSAAVSVFEITIRYIGGYLAAYQLTGDKILLDLAKVTADALIPAFNTPFGLPWSLIPPGKTGGHNYNWVSGRCGILADVGTLHLEWKTLSRELREILIA